MSLLPRLTVGIVTYNSARTITRTLESLAHQTLPSSLWNIMFVDHNSSDGTDEILERFANENPSAKLIRKDENNLARTREMLLQTCLTEWLAFVDSDIVLPPDWLETALAIADKSKEDISENRTKTFAGVGSPLRLMPLSPNLQEIKILQKHSLGHFGVEQMMISKENLRSVTHLPTAACLFDTKCLLENGGFDVSFGNCGEDLELGERLTGWGLKFWIARDLAVDHLLSCETRLQWLRRAFFFGQARIKVTRKHPRLWRNYRSWIPISFALLQIFLLFFSPLLLTGFWLTHVVILTIFFFELRGSFLSLKAASLTAMTHQAYAWGELYELVCTPIIRKIFWQKTDKLGQRRFFRRSNWIKTLALRKT